MINKLISLVILIFFFITGLSYSNNQFIFPKNKPSIFKKIEKNIISENSNTLPSKKPTIKGVNEKKEEIKKNAEKKEIKTNDKQAKIKKFIIPFVYPKKKTNYL